MARAIQQHYHKPWKLLVSVCLTRMNVISKELNEIEQRFAAFQEDLELRNSVYNDYEYRKNVLKADTLKVSKTNHGDEETVDAVQATRELASMQDQEDIWSADLKNLYIAPRATTDDQLGNRTSLNRCLDKELHFVVKDKDLLNSEISLYPYTALEANESLREASERLLQSHGINSTILFLNNAPVGVVKIRFKEDEKRGEIYQGAKVFFTKAQLRAPSKENTIDCKAPFEWLTLDELNGVCGDEYFRRVKTFVA